MIDIKNTEEIKSMKAGGKILSEVLWETLKKVKPGISEIELEKIAWDLIIKKGGDIAFNKVEGYKYATCISVNNVVVHGIPTENKLNEGDIIGIDCGVYLDELYTDMSETVGVGKISPEAKKFLDTGKKALDEAIKMAVVGNRIGHISQTIQRIVEEEGGYSVVRSLIGHGVGKSLHEDPEVPGYLDKKIEKTPVLKSGMTIAIEVIYNMGEEEVSYLNSDGWTIASSDGSLSGVFERTVLISENGPVILTP